MKQVDILLLIGAFQIATILATPLLHSDFDSPALSNDELIAFSTNSLPQPPPDLQMDDYLPAAGSSSWNNDGTLISPVGGGQQGTIGLSSMSIQYYPQEVDNNNNNQLFFEEASTPDDPLTAPIGGNLAQANSIPATPTLTTPAPGPASDNAPHQYFCCSAQVVRARFKDETCEEMRDVNTLVKNDGTTSPCENLVYDCPSEGVVGFIMKNCAFVQKKKTNPPNVIDHLACKILGTC